jgi:hypothetical protein
MWFERISQTRQPNLLIVGHERATQAAMLRILPSLAAPVHSVALPGQLELPDRGAGTLVLHNVVALSHDQQQQLLHWLEERSGTCVVSTATPDVFADVERGAFSDHLYYRLNIVLEKVGVSGELV